MLNVTWERLKSVTVHCFLLLQHILFIYLRLHIENKVMYTSSYKSVGGDGRGGEASYSRHYGSHGNNQTGESCRRKHVITLRILLNDGRQSNHSENSVKQKIAEPQGRAATLNSVMCVTLWWLFHIIKTCCGSVWSDTECWIHSLQHNVNKHGMRATPFLDSDICQLNAVFDIHSLRFTIYDMANTRWQTAQRTAT